MLILERVAALPTRRQRRFWKGLKLSPRSSWLLGGSDNGLWSGYQIWLIQLLFKKSCSNLNARRQTRISLTCNITVMCLTRTLICITFLTVTASRFHPRQLWSYSPNWEDGENQIHEQYLKIMAGKEKKIFKQISE